MLGWVNCFILAIALIIAETNSTLITSISIVLMVAACIYAIAFRSKFRYRIIAISLSAFFILISPLFDRTNEISFNVFLYVASLICFILAFALPTPDVANDDA